MNNNPLPDEKTIILMNKEYAQMLQKTAVLSIPIPQNYDNLCDLYKAVFRLKTITHSLYLINHKTSNGDIYHKILSHTRQLTLLLSELIPADKQPLANSLQAECTPSYNSNLYSLIDYNINVLELVPTALAPYSATLSIFFTKSLIISNLIILIK